jgi:mannose-6-phosphate isomerase-like protein (cupin superfamily)
MNTLVTYIIIGVAAVVLVAAFFYFYRRKGGGHLGQFHGNIYEIARRNSNFRTVIDTGKHAQIVVMSIPEAGEIGMETHPSIDQTLIFIEGTGKGILNGKSFEVEANDLVFVPAGTQHNFVNTGHEPLKLFTIYGPPAHRPNTVHKTKADADKDETDTYEKNEQETIKS